VPPRSRGPSPRRENPAPNPQALLESLPTELAAELAAVRDVVRQHLPAGYREAARKNMIVWEVPLERYPDTYNGRPLWYAALAVEKSFFSLHLMPVYGSKPLREKLQAGFKAAGKQLDMGKACIHFRAARDLALDVVGDVVASVPLDAWVEIAKAARPTKKVRR
jgi:hypothetical protein